jgi:hypothetical protein
MKIPKVPKRVIVPVVKEQKPEVPGADVVSCRRRRLPSSGGCVHGQRYTKTVDGVPFGGRLLLRNYSSKKLNGLNSGMALTACATGMS